MGGRQSIKNKEDDEDDKFDYDKKEKVFIAMNSIQGIAHDSSQKYLNMRSSITPTHALYITEKLKLAISETGIPIKQVKNIWHLFIKQLGRSAQGIFIQGIYNIFDISNTDIESLYLERLCLLMEKHNDYLVTFDEFFSIVSQFAIMNNSELIDFVFNMFDSDGNKFISKGDIIKVCEMKKNNVFLFPQNIVRAVEIFETRRGDKIGKSNIIIQRNSI
jgi:Ca2+-binding EF-hand superfamily protein